ncbi:hypothetical protein OAD24_11480 [Pseudomonadales bacterium]|nr:hypothetical protein [Pseudomonadales bacterium]
MPLGVSHGETPAGIRVLRQWRNTASFFVETLLAEICLSVFRMAKRLPAFVFCASGAKARI